MNLAEQLALCNGPAMKPLLDALHARSNEAEERAIEAAGIGYDAGYKAAIGAIVDAGNEAYKRGYDKAVEDMKAARVDHPVDG